MKYFVYNKSFLFLDISATTESGLTPLHVAAFMGCLNVAIHLVQQGAPADRATARGETPLHLAARAQQTDLIRVLLRNGAQVSIITALLFIKFKI